MHRFVRDDNSELPFYLHRRVRILKRPGEFHQPILGDSTGYYIEEDEFDALWPSWPTLEVAYSANRFMHHLVDTNAFGAP